MLFYNGVIVTIWDKKVVSTGIGMFIFMSDQCPVDKNEKISRQESFARILVHEYGHTIQSIILGPLFLLIIGLPSFLWAFIPQLKNYRTRNSILYFSIYTEKCVNYLGKK